MANTVGIRVDAEERKIWNRFKNATIRKYGKLHGAFSKEVMGAIKARLAVLEAEQHTPTPTNLSLFQRRLVAIFHDLPDDKSFDKVYLEMMIGKHAGGDQRTLTKYRRGLIIWEMIVRDGGSFRRGQEREWIKLAGEEK